MKYPQSTIPSATLTEIATMYGVRAHSWHAVEGGYRNVSYSFLTDDGRMLNFILYKYEPESAALVARTNALGSFIAGQGLPVRAPVDTRILRVGQRYGSLYVYLPGTTIPWEAYTMKHIKLLGFALARFHDAAAGYDGPSLPDVETIYESIYERMQRYFSDSDVSAALRDKLHISLQLPDFQPLLDVAKTMPNRTALHMDMVRSNLLFAETTGEEMLAVKSVALSGILDLEKAAMGHPLFDIARTLAFLLVDCNKPEAKIRKYFLHSGYEKRGDRAIGDGEMLEQLVTMFLVYDFYKFLRQNPYESLQKNHHFIRTEHILRARKVLQ